MNSLNRQIGNFYPSPADTQIEDRIGLLINSIVPEEQNIDQAYELAKSVESSVVLHFLVSDVCLAYLRLGTQNGCEKAYGVALYKESQKANIYSLLSSIIEDCIAHKSPESIELADKIFKNHAKCLALSLLKNDFQMAKAQVEHRYGKVKLLKQEVAKVPQVKTVTQVQAIQPPAIPATVVDGDEVEKNTFAAIESDALEVLCEQLNRLDAPQKAMYFVSTMKLRTTWAGGEEEMTPLQYACHLGKKDVVELLIEQGALVDDFRNTSDSTQRGSIHFALDAGNADIALILLAKGATDRLASCETLHAFRKYQLPAEYGGSWTCLTALHMAIIKNLLGLVQAIVTTDPASLKVRSSGGYTPLHLAVRCGDKAMVEWLRAHGADASLNQKTSSGMTPRDIAVAKKFDHLLPL